MKFYEKKKKQKRKKPNTRAKYQKESHARVYRYNITLCYYDGYVRAASFCRDGFNAPRDVLNRNTRKTCKLYYYRFITRSGPCVCAYAV